MASSDDEGETVPDEVSDYYFCAGDDEPVSFSKLAVQWNESESTTTNEGLVFLRGTADNGLQKFYQQVKAWKYDFSKTKPEISALTKDNHWIKLQKPRKSFEKEIRTILVTVHCLYFCKSKPEASGKTLWDHLSKVFSSYDVRPSENDLIDHTSFIREAVKRDETLAKSKFLAAFLENPRKRKSPDEDAETATKPSFIVDDINGEPQDDDFAKHTEDSESDEEEDNFDSVCAICDNGGDILCCEGECFRSFHATVDIEEAQEANCESLDLPPEVVKGKQPFRCENCLYKQHQCYVCGELGSSDKTSVAEVFRCSAATCGHFYHPKCVAKLLGKDCEAEPQDLEEKIAAGEPFICPAHKCFLCKQTENEKVEDLQFAICRRCPKSYHRKCLPRKIVFDQDDDDDIVRAWDGLLPKSRALIYCLKHQIDEELGTPARTLKCRNIGDIKKVKPSELPSNKKKVAVKETGLVSEDTFKKSSNLKSQKDAQKSAVRPEGSSKKRAAVSSGPESVKKKRVTDASKNSLRKSLSTKVKIPSSNDGQPSLGSRLYEYMNKGTESNNWEKADTSVDEEMPTMGAKSPPREYLPPIDADSKERVLALMKDAASSITLDDVKASYREKIPSTYAHGSRVDKSIILARVEGSVEAIHLAMKKLEEGCSLEDAMAVCEPRILEQVLRWKEKLRVYLAPFLHGMRYTSFGRHFTKVDKLVKIVDKLQWYVGDNDTVVDFCCGANDFSVLLKKRLDEMGKTNCSYKNYDITRPKNDFNFTKRDWMSVRTKELPSGSHLIMGLNPPFGKNASLANQFVAKALQFNPKLLVLIVPPETERLDSENRQTPYDLIWEDGELLAGKSFYLPGSLDVNDKHMDQWNISSPPLYLWSRPDWTSRHKAIALQRGHISDGQQKASQSDDNVTELNLPNEIIEGDIPVLPLDNLPVVKQGSEVTTDKAKPDIKNEKDENALGKKSNQSSSNHNRNRSRRTSELKTEKQDDAGRSVDRHLDTEEPELSFRNEVDIPFDHHLERRINSSLRDQARDAMNDVGQPIDRHLERRHNPTTELDQPFDHHLERQHNPSRQDQSRETINGVDRHLERRHNAVTEVDLPFDRHLERQHNPSRQDQSRETLNDAGQRVDRHLERRHSPISEGPEFSFRNEVDQPFDFDHHLERRLNSSLQDQARETLNDVGQPVDRYSERRHNPAVEESDFSFRNDVGQPFDHHFERRTEEPFGQPFDHQLERRTEEPYVNALYRRLGIDGANASFATPSYSIRPEPAQYSSYDRVRREPYLDEIGASVGSYTMTHREPGLPRYGSVDPAPYNRTNTSATQRYAPRLDELNHVVRPEPDEMNHARMSHLGRVESHMVSQGLGGYGASLHGPGFRSDPWGGFATGPYHPYSQQHNSSGGWLNE